MLNNGSVKKKIVYSVLIIFVLTLFVLYFIPKISIKDCKHGIYDVYDSAYDLGYNIYGEPIFKNRDKALKQFKKDYAQGLKYMEEKGFPKFSTKYETLVKYGVYCWQTYVPDDVENKDELVRQLNVITVFSYTYWSGNWQHYFPLYKSIS